MKIEQLARIAHEANKGLCDATGDSSQKTWDEAPDWQRESAIKGVEFGLANPGEPDSAQHDAWCRDKLEAGWVYGETKDAAAKTHPCLVPFDRLPPEQQAKDVLFKSIVNALAPYVGRAAGA